MAKQIELEKAIKALESLATTTTTVLKHGKIIMQTEDADHIKIGEWYITLFDDFLVVENPYKRVFCFSNGQVEVNEK